MGYAVVEKVVSLQEEELKFLDNVRNCVNMRIKCDREYAQSLLAVSICAKKCRFSEDIGKTNIGKVWTLIAEEMESLSKLMAVSAEELTREVLELVDEVMAEKRAMRKALIEEHNKYSTKLDNVSEESSPKALSVTDAKSLTHVCRALSGL